MKSKKSRKMFSEAFIKLANEAGIDNTFIPDVWKMFFKSSGAKGLTSESTTGVKRNTSSTISTKKAARKKSRQILKKAAKVSVVSELNRLAIKKSASRVSPAKKSASLKRHAPKRSALKTKGVKK